MIQVLQNSVDTADSTVAVMTTQMLQNSADLTVEEVVGDALWSGKLEGTVDKVVAEGGLDSKLHRHTVDKTDLVVVGGLGKKQVFSPLIPKPRHLDLEFEHPFSEDPWTDNKLSPGEVEGEEY